MTIDDELHALTQHSRISSHVARSLLILAAAVSFSGAAGAQDASHGKTVFNRCIACHTPNKPSKIGPDLTGVVGRQAASVEGFRYSAALAASGMVWDDAALDRFLTAPAKAVPGTSMAISLASAQDRADVIAYLKTLTKP